MKNKLKNYFSFEVTYHSRRQFLWKIFPFFLFYTALFLGLYFQPQDFAFIIGGYLWTLGAIHLIFLWFVFLISFYLLCRIYENKNNFIKLIVYLIIVINTIFSFGFPFLGLGLFLGASDCDWRGFENKYDRAQWCEFDWSDLSNLILVGYVMFLIIMVIGLLLSNNLQKNKNEQL